MASKNKIISKEDIVSIYMNEVLEKGEKPKSVYHFVKDKDFTNDFLVSSLSRSRILFFFWNTGRFGKRNFQVVFCQYR